jgi:hypothetical protein
MKHRVFKTGANTAHFASFAVISFSFIASAPSQDTIQSGFEEYAAGTRPPFVIIDVRTISNAAVADASTVPSVPPFEQQKFLWGGGSIFIQSPNGQPIESYTLHLFLQDAPNLRFGIEGQRNAALQFNTWQIIQGSFTSPVQQFNVSGFYSIGETFAAPYAIDAVEFTTVPESGTFWLLTLGLGAILLGRSKF